MTYPTVETSVEPGPPVHVDNHVTMLIQLSIDVYVFYYSLSKTPDKDCTSLVMHGSPETEES